MTVDSVAESPVCIACFSVCESNILLRRQICILVKSNFAVLFSLVINLLALFKLILFSITERYHSNLLVCILLFNMLDSAEDLVCCKIM